MKLGTETGSLINHVVTHCRQIDPQIGMAATLCHWSDREPGTVTGIDASKKATIIEIQYDTATRTDSNGESESQSYDYARDPKGGKSHFRWNSKKNKWVQVYWKAESKRWVLGDSDGAGLVLGEREKYWDPSF